MRRIPGYFVAFCLVGAFVLATPADALAAPERGTDPEIEALQSEIDARGQHWTAKRNWTSDLTDEEFEGLLGLRIPPEVARRFAALDESQFPVRRDLPTSFDWRDYDGMTAVKHQGGCGSCWDFAATGVLEAVVKIHEGIEYDLSEQQILSCATPGYGCDGGWMSWAWGYVREYGAVLEGCMPYQGDDTLPCTDEPCGKVAVTSEWVDVPNSVAALKTAIMTAPIAVTFRVYSSFGDYGSGCYEHEGDDPPNHAVVCLGWDDDLCGGEGAWLCKNSWGENFGDLGGYFWIKYGTCNFASTAQLLYYYEGTEIVYKGHTVLDGRGRPGSGDGDGHADPGETVSFPVTLKNDLLAPDRTGVAATLTTASSHVTITQGTSSFGNLAAGESSSGTPPFEFTVDQFAPVGESVEFVLSITATSRYARSDTFSIILGPVPVLLVDDDGGESTQSYFQGALENTGYPFNMWIEELDGDVPLEELERYAVVVWDNGWGGKLGDNNRSALESYLDAGRPLMISGEDIGWFMNHDGDPILINFYEDYLHADYIEDDSGFRSLTGVPGDPIGDGLSFTLNGEGCAMNQFYPSEIEPRSGAVPVFEYAPGTVGAIRIDDPHRLVYLAFGLEGVTNSADRDTIMRRSLEWLAGGAWPDTEQPEVTLTSPVGGEELPGGETHEITWEATDNAGVTSIDILCSWDSGATFPDAVAAGEENDGSFAWSVPDTSSTTCRVRVIARDAAGLAWHDDSDDFATTGGTGIPDGGGRRFALEQNVPNPFNPVTHIAYSIPRAAHVELRIYDVTGKVVRRLVDAELAANDYVAVWNGRTDEGQASASGIYFYRLTADGQELARKMILLR
jgi:C1A family cysteine protease